MKTIAFKTNFHRSLYIPVVIFIAILFTIIATKVVNYVDYPNSDFFTFWLSGRLASLGQNPYNSELWINGHHQFSATWIPNQTFIYPIPVSLLFLLLGLVDLYQAYIVWVVLLQLMIIASIILLMNQYKDIPIKPFYLPVIAGSIIFRPTIVTLLNGQISGLLLLLIAIIIYSWEKGKWNQGAALLAFLALKPNLGVPLIALLSLYLIQRKQISALITGAISGFLLMGVGWFQNPNWIPDFWSAGNTKISQIFGFSPTVWGISANFCDHNLICTLGYGGFITILFLAAYLYLLLKNRAILSPALVVSLAVIIMLLLTPSCWPYDQLLLIAPIVTITMSLARKGYRYLPVSLIFLVIDILAWILLGVGVVTQLEIWSVGVPLFTFLLLIYYLSTNRLISLNVD